MTHPPPRPVKPPSLQSAKLRSSIEHDAEEDSESSLNKDGVVQRRTHLFEQGAPLPVRPAPPKPPGCTPKRNGAEEKDEGASPLVSVAVRSRLFEEESGTEPKPIYAQVNKQKKAESGQNKNIYDGASNLRSDVTKPKNVYDGVIVLDGDGSIEEVPVQNAPPKPPRTFAHDEYIQIKAEKKQLKRDKHRRVSPVPMQDLYEDISVVQESKPQRIYSTVRPGGKLPPPPRPPRPSSLEEKEFSRRDSATVHVIKHNDSVPSDSFISATKLTNPGYAKKTPEIIPITTFPSRSKSEEYLYVMEDGRGVRALHVDDDGDDEPIYQEPVDVLHDLQPRGITAAEELVTIDADGYAVPDVKHYSLSRQRSVPAQYSPGGTLLQSETNRLKTKPAINKKFVREKVSRAYSILHLNMIPPTEDSPRPPDIAEEDDSDTEVDQEQHQRHLKHVNSVRDRTFERVQHYGRLKEQPQQKLFDYGLIVGLEKMEDRNIYKPKVLFKFPEETSDEVSQIGEFCFPDASVWRPVTLYDSESFSFVLTKEDGTRQYGYCRRMLPPGQGNRLPEVMCVVSLQEAIAFYDQLLLGLERKRYGNIELSQHLLQAAYAKPLPPPGKEIMVRSMGKTEKLDTLVMQRPRDACRNDICFGSLLTHLPVDVLLQVFASILLERRLLFIAQHLSTLTTCIHGLHALLYPFEWQHTFVPVLPASMVDVVCAPTPYILGILTSLQPQLQQFPLEEVLIVDLDNKSLLKKMGDESGIIPKKLQKALMAAIKEDADTVGARDIMISEAFLRMFVETIGHYTEFVVTQQDGILNFQKEAFVKAVSSLSIQMFLEWFTETQMFEVFITDKLEGRLSNTELFELSVEEYREEMAGLESSFAQHMKQVGQKMINFFKGQGDKIKAKLNKKNVYV